MRDFHNIIANENAYPELQNETLESIRAFEGEWGICIPKVLAEFYMQHNAADLKNGPFFMYYIEEAFFVDFIIPLRDTNVSVERLLKCSREDGGGPESFVPFAEDLDGGDYFFDNNTGYVYYFSYENSQSPIPIADGMAQFFTILERACSNSGYVYIDPPAFYTKEQKGRCEYAKKKEEVMV